MFQVKKGAHLAVLLGCILYGMTGLFLAHIHNLPITSIIFYRLFFGLAFIFTFLLVTNRLGELKPGKRKFRLLVQGIFVLVNMFFYFVCVKETCVSIAILLEYTAPIYVMLASPFILKEKIGKGQHCCPVPCYFRGLPGDPPGRRVWNPRIFRQSIHRDRVRTLCGNGPCSYHYERADPEKRSFRICHCILGHCNKLPSDDAFCF